MSQSLLVSDDLFNRIQQTAAENGLSVEQLLARLTRSAEASGRVEGETSGHVISTDDEGALVALTSALLAGEEPPIPVDWAEVQAALDASHPAYGTIEDAMGALRGRAWSKDT